MEILYLPCTPVIHLLSTTLNSTLEHQLLKFSTFVRRERKPVTIQQFYQGQCELKEDLKQRMQ